ncbi:MAG: adenine phosphoribosyltransferase [Candidatus Pacebacteria bacterium]|nr:adenine phosphoribosyltransferase [Candidatus Paceibacterota bacterium]
MNIKSFIQNVPNFPKPGIMFRDISPLLANADAFGKVVGQIADEWKGSVDMIIALDARGFVFGAPVALALGVPFVMIRKKGKLPGEVVSYSYDLEYGSDTVEMKHDALKAGDRVLVVDDLLATGGTAAAACALVESVGATVAGCVFVIELVGLGGREKLGDHAVQALVSYEEN